MGDKRAQITIKGANPEAKFKHLEVILKRLARRMNEKVVGIMPPSIIFQYAKKPEPDGVLLRGIFPSGELTKICLAIKKYNTKKAVKFICNLETRVGIGKQFIFETHKELLTEDINLSIDDVGFFTLRIDLTSADINENSPPLIEDIWTTALFQVKQSDSKIKTVMLGELEKLEDLSERI